MNSDILKQILENHKKWIRSEPDGSFADLRRSDLRGANLLRADISCADLRGADLRGADLREADLRGTDLREADLRGAVLCGADLREAVLRGADLRGAICVSANMENADLMGADLNGAYMQEIKTNEETKIDWPMSCPETGAFIAWKKAGKYIVKLEIPADAKRSSATTNKCRASKAKVLEIQSIFGTEIQSIFGTKRNTIKVRSGRGGVYMVGAMVYPNRWDDHRWNECSNGIHFFMTREEALEW